ncbi:peptidoglycan recognition protein family protein [Paenibacillus xerothermodurans]|nr:peptidoglycan recognition family protein [Paenibacillus xerothermodurans]
MKYDIVPRYLSGPSKRRPTAPMQPCRFIVAHDTGNPGSTAAGNVAYYQNTRNAQEASAHIFVDDKQILECIPFLTARPEKAWHVRYNVPGDNQRYGVDANDAAGGIELCHGGSIDIKQAYSRYVWLIAFACYTYNLNPSVDIAGHFELDPARRTDPKGALQLLGKTFRDFIEDVTAEYAACIRSDNPPDVIAPEDANKIIRFLSAGYMATEVAEARTEFNRLANELRRRSGQPLQ